MDARSRELRRHRSVFAYLMFWTGLAFLLLSIGSLLYSNIVSSFLGAYTFLASLGVGGLGLIAIFITAVRARLTTYEVGNGWIGVKRPSTSSKPYEGIPESAVQKVEIHKSKHQILTHTGDVQVAYGDGKQTMTLRDVGNPGKVKKKIKDDKSPN